MARWRRLLLLSEIFASQGAVMMGIVNGLGGDEFVIVTPHLGPAEGAGLAARIVRRVANQDYAVGAGGRARMGRRAEPLRPVFKAGVGLFSEGLPPPYASRGAAGWSLKVRWVRMVGQSGAVML